MMTIVLWLFLFIILAIPIAALPNLEQCTATPFKGNPNVTEYKCPAVSYIPR